MFEGYGFGAHRRRRRRSSRGGRTAWQKKFAAASRACRGKGKTARMTCMRKKLRGKRSGR